MSARSTGTPSFRQMYCCLRREPQVLCNRLKRMPPELSVAGKTFTGIDTRPKVSDREAMERAAIGPPSFEAGLARDSARPFTLDAPPRVFTNRQGYTRIGFASS